MIILKHISSLWLWLGSISNSLEIKSSHIYFKGSQDHGWPLLTCFDRSFIKNDQAQAMLATVYVGDKFELSSTTCHQQIVLRIEQLRYKVKTVYDSDVTQNDHFKPPTMVRTTLNILVYFSFFIYRGNFCRLSEPFSDHFLNRGFILFTMVDIDLPWGKSGWSNYLRKTFHPGDIFPTENRFLIWSNHVLRLNPDY